MTGARARLPRSFLARIPADLANNVNAANRRPNEEYHRRGVSARDRQVALRRVAGDAVAARVTFREDDAIGRIVQSWPVDFDTVFARKLGMRADADFESIVRQYVDDELDGRIG